MNSSGIVFAVMAAAPRHTFQLLTKRHGRMRSLLSSPRFESLAVASMRINEIRSRADGEWQWPLPNVWGGVSVEDQRRAELRIGALLGTPFAVRFLSCEPMLGSLDITPFLPCEQAGCGICTSSARVDWVIAGGESGHGARPMHPDWARSLRDQCVDARIPFLFKQWGEWAPPDPIGYQTEHGPVHRFAGGAIVDRVGKKRAGRELDGRTWDEYPDRAA